MTRTNDDSEPTDHRQASDGTADSGATSSTPSPSPGNDSPTVPRSAGQLERAVRKFSRTRGLAERRVRDWISYMALGGRLEAASHAHGEGPLFTFKGGVVMELRRRGAARATQDLDLTYLGAETDIVLVMQDAVAEPYGRFSFRLSGTPREMANVNTTRVELAVRFDGTRWGTVVVDVSRGESHAVEVEFVPAFDLWCDFGVAGPKQLPCLSARARTTRSASSIRRPWAARYGTVADRLSSFLP